MITENQEPSSVLAGVNEKISKEKFSGVTDLNVPSRMIVVSNRLPITVGVKGGKIRLEDSVGGLATGLNAYLHKTKGQSNHIWIGAPNVSAPRISGDLEGRMRQTLAENNLAEVTIPREVMRRFYYGFCNKTLWPLFHYFPSYTTFENDDWTNYQQLTEFSATRS